MPSKAVKLWHLPRVHMVTRNRVPLQWTGLQIWFLTNHCWSEHGIGLGSSPKVSPTLAAKNQAELSLQNQPALVVFGFQGGFYFPSSPALCHSEVVYFHVSLGQCSVTHCPVFMMYWPGLLTLLKVNVCPSNIFSKSVGHSRGFSPRRWGMHSAWRSWGPRGW